MQKKFVLSMLFSTVCPVGFVHSETDVISADALVSGEKKHTFIINVSDLKHVRLATDETEEQLRQLESDIQFCNHVIETAGDKNADLEKVSDSGYTAVQLLTFFHIMGAHVEQHLKKMLDHNAQVDKADSAGRTPLYYLIKHTIVKELTDENLQNIEDQDRSQDTEKQTEKVPTTREKNLKLIELFLQHGADIFMGENPFVESAEKSQKESPFTIALENGDKEILQLFAKHGGFQIIELSPEEASEISKLQADQNADQNKE